MYRRENLTKIKFQQNIKLENVKNHIYTEQAHRVHPHNNVYSKQHTQRTHVRFYS